MENLKETDKLIKNWLGKEPKSQGKIRRALPFKGLSCPKRIGGFLKKPSCKRSPKFIKVKGNPRNFGGAQIPKPWVKPPFALNFGEGKP